MWLNPLAPAKPKPPASPVPAAAAAVLPAPTPPDDTQQAAAEPVSATGSEPKKKAPPVTPEPTVIPTPLPENSTRLWTARAGDGYSSRVAIYRPRKEDSMLTISKALNSGQAQTYHQMECHLQHPELLQTRRCELRASGKASSQTEMGSGWSRQT